jgi:Helix-turn-helix domain
MMTDRVTSLLSLASQDDLVRLLRASNRSLEPKAAAAYLHVSVRCLEDWRKRGVGPKWRKVGKRVLYWISDLDAFLDEGAQTPPDHAVTN